MRKRILFLTLISITAIFSGCGIYSFTGGSVGDLKTVSVSLFENNAALVNPNLSQSFTEALKDRIRSQTSLNFVRTEAEADFSGNITNYTVQPVATQGTQQVTAGLTRLTITIQVKYTNTKDPTKSFDQSFSRYVDFDQTKGAFASQEQKLVKQVNDQLTEDIYNKAFANW